MAGRSAYASGHRPWSLAPATAAELHQLRALSRHAQRYGTRRLRAALQAEGHALERYAAGCVAAACGRQVRGRTARVPP